MTRPPKVVFVNRYYRPDMSATAQILTSLAEALAGQGHDVQVITSRQLYGDARAQLPRRERIGGVEVVRVDSTKFGRKQLAGRFVDYITFARSAAAEIRRTAQRGDVIVAKTDPPNLANALEPVARKCGLTFKVWCQDMFPEVAAPGRVAVPSPMLPLRVMMGARDRAYRGASRVIAISEDMRGYMVERGIPADRIDLVPNWCVPADLSPVQPGANALRREWGLDDKFVVAYSGNLGRAHDYRTFIQAISTIGTRSDVRFLFIGAGAMQDRLREELPGELQQQVLFKPYQPLERLAESLSVGDVHLMSLRALQSRYIYPSKYYGILAVGRPVFLVGDVQSSLAREITEAGIGAAYAEGAGEALAGGILRLLNNPEERLEMGLRARNRHESHYAFNRRLTQWEQMLGTPAR